MGPHKGVWCNTIDNTLKKYNKQLSYGFFLWHPYSITPKSSSVKIYKTPKNMVQVHSSLMVWLDPGINFGGLIALQQSSKSFIPHN